MSTIWCGTKQILWWSQFKCVLFDISLTELKEDCQALVTAIVVFSSRPMHYSLKNVRGIQKNASRKVYESEIHTKIYWGLIWAETQSLCHPADKPATNLSQFLKVVGTHYIRKYKPKKHWEHRQEFEHEEHRRHRTDVEKQNRHTE